ncbi:MAG TPA: hypothetical protein VFS11_06670 [Gemmatimonadales bacterium]|nr:hypothetical protein [Gemmatimonadales bacterium]
MSDVLPVRVMVQEVWDEVNLDLPATTPLGEVKRLALERTRVRRDPEGYLLKYRGAEQDETQTLAGAGVVANAPMIVLPRRRRPVR